MSGILYLEMTREELKKLVNQKIKAAERLMAAEEWAFAAYVMGYALECALKAVSCKTLKLNVYPPVKKNSREAEGFRSHDFEQLLFISGMNGVFQLEDKAYDNWSAFTLTLNGDWTNMRYDRGAEKRFDEPTVRDLYKNLYDDEDSIIQTIKGKRKW